MDIGMMANNVKRVLKIKKSFIIFPQTRNNFFINRNGNRNQNTGQIIMYYIYELIN